MTDSAELAFSQINYGRGLVTYQKHSYTIDRGKNKIDDVTTNFGLYKSTALQENILVTGNRFTQKLQAQKIYRQPLNIQ